MRICQTMALNKGYTLIETVLALAGLTLLLSLSPLVIHVLNNSPNEISLDPHEVELFFIQANMEVKDSVKLYLNQEKLILLKSNGDEVSYVHYKNLIRRQVDNRGHEPLLNNIRDVQFKLLGRGRGVKIIVTGTKGRSYERIFSLFTSRVAPPSQ